jgi:cytoskeletal protein RodZ
MNEITPLDPNPDERLGEFIRRARETAGIDREQFAHEVRFGTEILDNLENGNYDKLPVRAYVRGYLNTVSSRLNLDRNKLMALYDAETGKNRFDTTKISSLEISPENPNSGSESSATKPIIVLVALLLGLLFFVLKMNDDSGSTPFPEDNEELVDTSDEFDSIAPHDTVGLTDEEAEEAPMVDIPEAVEEAPDAATTSRSEPVETVLKIECLRDSTWVRVKRIGGRTFVRYVHSTELRPRVISHTDTMQVNVGAPEKTRMHINNSRVKIPNGTFYVYNGAIVE